MTSFADHAVKTFADSHRERSRSRMSADLRDLARRLGGEVSNGEIHCPGPGHSGRDRSLSVRPCADAPDGFQVWSFANNDWRDCRDHVRSLLSLERRQFPRLREKPTKPSSPDDNRIRDLKSAARIVSRISPIIEHAQPMEYLRKTRLIDTDAIVDVLSRTDAIGWHPAAYFNQPDPNELHHEFHGQRLGAIISILTDPVTAKPTGAISRTYLRPDLTKIGKAKTLGAPVGITRLSSDEDVLAGLHLAEGVETGLYAMALGFRPLWATGSTSLLASFPVLNGIECLTVLADRDRNEAGERAAKAAADRWQEAGRKAHIKRLKKGWGDLNDIALRKAE
jgi:hypothetical protein